MKIIHISDLHYNHTGNNTGKLVEKIIEHYKDTDQKPVIVNSGDLIENGGKKQLSGCKLHLKKLQNNGFELLFCPGNHDVRKVKGSLKNKRGLLRFDAYLRDLLPVSKNYLGEEDNNLIDFPIVHNYGNFYFIGLDSNRRKKNLTPSGKLGSDQLEELQQLLSQIKEEDSTAVITIYLHHNPFKFNINIRNVIHFKQMRLVDRDKFLEVIQSKVDVLLFGHSHWDERYFDEESRYDFKIAQLSAAGTHSTEVTFNELDLKEFTVTRI